MPAAVTDKFTQASSGTRPVPTTLSASLAAGSSPGTATCAALTGWPTVTAVHFIIYNKDTSGAKLANTQTDWKATVVGNTLTNLTLLAGTNTGYSVGAVVEAAPTAGWANDVANGLLVSHAQDGSLLTSAVQTALNLGTSALNGWNPLGFTFTYGANNGNKEFTVTTPSDLTSTLSSGMRFQLTRSTTAPTQAMSFTAASSQYASKTSPTGITFTGNFTIEAWVYLNSTGATRTILSRNNGTNAGFELNVAGSGQVQISFANGTAYTDAYSFAKIPTKKWTHIAASVVVATKAMSIYINGELRTTFSNNTGAAAVSQPAQDLTIGKWSGGGNYFDGYLSETRLWTAAQTQAQVQANMGISLTGSETNLIGLWQGNGNFNDKTANANNMTASGGAIATQVANPYNAVEYANVISASYSSPNTTVTLNTGSYGTIPNMTLLSPQYSTQNMPFGFPKVLERPYLAYIETPSNFSTASASMTAIDGMTATVTIPTGGQNIRISFFCADVFNSSAVYANIGIFDGTVASGKQISFSRNWSSTATRGISASCSVVVFATAGSHTYQVGLQAEGGGTANVVNTAYLMIEPV